MLQFGTVRAIVTLEIEQDNYRIRLIAHTAICFLIHKVAYEIRTLGETVMESEAN